MLPKQAKMFMWDFKQDGDRLEINAEVNDGCNFVFEYNQEQNSLKCTVDELIYPIISGIFYAPTLYAEHRKDGNKHKIVVRKVRAIDWPYVMEKPIDAAGDLDFNSTFLKYLHEQTPELEFKVNALKNAGFIPAMMHFAQKALNEGKFDEAVKILEGAVYYDGYLPAILMLGEALMTKKPEIASKLLQRGQKMGSVKAAQLLGNLYDPLTKFGVEKDPETAVFYYTKGVNQNDPVSMVYLAQMIERGLAPNTGFDPKKLCADAKEIDPSIVVQNSRSLFSFNANLSEHKWWLIGGATAVAGAFIIYKGVKSLLKRRH